MNHVLTIFTNYFFLWTVIGGVFAFIFPGLYTWFLPYISYGLGVIMLGMGLTLKLEDFRRILDAPLWVLVGLGLQFTVMPLLGLGVGLLLELPAEYAVGLVLVASCPGGTASNVISFLARANVALSVSMTAFSTSLAIIATPLLTDLLAGNRVEVNVLGLILNTFTVVIIPITLGVFLNVQVPKFTSRLQKVAPALAVIFIVLIVGAILGINRDKIIDPSGGFARDSLRLIVAVFIVHLGGFGLGYTMGLLFTGRQDVARTISIEVGMQNSGLGSVLARNNFSSPLFAVPSALSALCHCILGSICAAWWSRRPIPEQTSEEEFLER